MNGAVGRLAVEGVGPRADGHAVGYAPPLGGATVTSDETGALAVPRRFSSVLFGVGRGR